MSAGVVPQEDALRSIYEFLDSCGYKESIIALQAESGIPYNVIRVVESTSESDGATRAERRVRVPGGRTYSFPSPSLARLEEVVLDGNWPEVLNGYVDGTLLPEDLRAELYEVIFEELLEVYGLLPAAKAFFYNAPAFAVMHQVAPARFARLERLLLEFDPVVFEESKGKRAGALGPETVRRRTSVLHGLKSVLCFSKDPYMGRLPAALLVASERNEPAEAHEAPLKRTREESAERAAAARVETRKQQSSDGQQTALATRSLLGKAVAAPRAAQTVVKTENSDSCISCCALLCSGTDVGGRRGTSAEAPVVVLAESDGSVSFLEPLSRTYLGKPLKHTAGALTLCIDSVDTARDALHDAPSCEPAVVAVGYRDGTVRAYDTESRALVQGFPQCHSLGVTSLVFGGRRETVDGKQRRHLLISGSYDATIKVLSLVTGSVLSSIADSHKGAFVNALCGFSHEPSADGDAAMRRECVVSAGNDGTLAFWSIDDTAAVTADVEKSAKAGAKVVQRLGSNVNVRALHSECRDAVPSSLTLVSEDAAPADAQAETAEVLVLTRSVVALIVSVRIDRSPEAAHQPVQPTLLCLLRSSKPLRHVSCHPPGDAEQARDPRGQKRSSATDPPALSVYATNVDGTVLLYNIEMTWRDAQRWKAFGGALTVSQPTDESSAVIAEVGHTVSDLHLCALPGVAGRAVSVLASAPSLHSLYRLS